MRPNPEVVRFNQKLDAAEKEVKRINKVIRYFPETHMGNSHHGLAEIAAKHKINVNKLEPGEFVIFANSDLSALKMYAAGNIIAHLRMPGSQKINPRVIAMIPRFFNGSQIEYDKALREVIQKEFGH